jgi:hypothetical protein
MELDVSTIPNARKALFYSFFSRFIPDFATALIPNCPSQILSLFAATRLVASWTS